MLSHALGKSSEPDARKEVDAESRVLGAVLDGQHVGVVLLHRGLLEALDELLESEDFLHLLEEDLDKDTGRRGRVVFVHVDDIEAGPADRVRRQEMTKEASNVAQPVRLVAMDAVVVGAEAFFEEARPLPSQLAHALPNVTVKSAEGTLLRAALDDHVAELDFLALGDLELEELVRRFLEDG